MSISNNIKWVTPFIDYTT